ncbi:MAG: VWA domain-containing protein [Acidobacteriota bacterium]
MPSPLHAPSASSPSTLRRGSLCALLALLLGLVALPLAAQQEATFEDAVEVTEVLLDVQVTDEAGNVVVGLGPEDFRVSEDGDLVALDSVVFYSHRLLEAQPGGEAEANLGASLEARGSDLDRQPRDRYFILLFEDQRRKAGEAPGIVQRQLQAGKYSKDWVQQDLQPGDWVAVLSYDVKLRLHQDFTQDQELLEGAIDRAVRSAGGENWPSRIGDEGDRGIPSLAAHLPQGEALGDSTETIYEGLQELAKAAGSTPGRKNLLLFSLGFGRVDTFGGYQPDARYTEPTIRHLNDSNIATYAIDLSLPNVRHTMAGSLNHFANATGGEYLFNHSTFRTALSRVSKANNGYYLLSYQSRHPADKSGYQEVEVEATNPEFEITARDGYLFGD